MSTTIAYTQKDAQLDKYQLIEAYKTLISEKMQSQHLIGVGAALILGDSVVWKEGFGYADKENDIPFTTNTAMAIGSITKVFTSMGIMQLQEHNMLNVDDPLVKYLPQFKINSRTTDIKEITVKSLIQHTSGLPRDFFLNIWNSNEKYTNTVEYIKNEYLAFPANMVYHYSNVGYTLLGHTIFNVSKLDYPLYIQKNILKSVGMTNSGFFDYSSLKNITKTYDNVGVYMPLKTGRDLPEGALHSTIDDMVKFAQEIISIYHGKNGGFLKPETLKLLEKINNDNLENINTSLGWDVFRNDSCLLISHLGSYHLTNATIVIDLKRKNAAVFFANTVGGMDLVGEAMGKFQEISGVNPSDYVHQNLQTNSVSNNISIDLQKAHTGIYVNTNEILTVEFDNDMLTLNTSFGNFKLKPFSNDEFIPGIIVQSDTVRWLKNGKFIFSEIQGFKLLFWQDANNKRQLLGQLVIPQKVNDIWRKRLGIYELDGFKLEGWEKYSKFELSLADHDLLTLKVFCTTGEYLYYLRIENDNELIICGFGETGGETISFSKDGQNNIMKLMGLPIKKITNNK
jgi:CubicO group peptidase (beta-lactamase class C family)